MAAEELYSFSRIGFGCSRLGSIGSAKGSDPAELLNIALQGGINVFDTADIYGQGESERILAEQLRGANNINIITKAGQYFPWYWRALRPAKAAAKELMRYSGAFEAAIAASRAGKLPTDFSTDRMHKCLDGSLKRLSPLPVEIFMLHGPSAETTSSPVLQRALREMLELGLVRRIGVACDNEDAAVAAVKGNVFSVIQVPISYENSRFISCARAAREAGKVVIAREVLGGIRAVGAPVMQEPEVIDRITKPLLAGWADVTLIGTSNAKRLKSLLLCLGESGFL
ncbi:hypothetical protein FOHLNKBM_6088 [Methylobacterium longum]|nr:hypothetical protein FOHLNKBM_6088 [Methylobacterium longum]